MEFKEFTEYPDLEGADADIKLSLKEDSCCSNDEKESLKMDLLDLIGILEDVDDEYLMKKYGITLKEYLNPTRETVLKVAKCLEDSKRHK